MTALSRPFAAALLLLGLVLACPAYAHPHVFVVVKSEILFNDEGLVSGVRHAWTFDEMYSAFATTGIDNGGKPATAAQLQPVAEQNVQDLVEFSYFTVFKSPGQKIEFGKPTDVAMNQDDKKLVTLSFTLPLKKPASAARALTMQVYDPTYFVSFDFASDGVRLAAPPSGCSISVVPPRALGDSEQQKLTEAFFSGLSPGSDFGVKLAGRALVACP